MNKQDRVWTWRQVLQRAVQILREEGIKSLWFKILGETVYRRVVLVERPLDKPLEQTSPEVPVEITLLADTEIDDYLQFRPEDDPFAIRCRIAAGQLCFVVRHEGHIVHTSWLAPRRAWIAYLACEVQLAPDEIYSYETYTAPSFRGHNIAAARSEQARRYCHATGYRRMVAAVMPENVAGLRLVMRVGYSPIGVIGYVKLGPWRWAFCSVKPRTRTSGEPMRIVKKDMSWK